MSSKLGINHNKSISLKISINILIIFTLASITIPAQATSLKNIPFAEQLKPNKNENNNTSLNTQLVPISSKLFSKNSERKNELEVRLLEEVEDTINEVKEANKVSKEYINGQTVYFYSLKTIKPVALSNNTNISGTNQITWKLSSPKPRRKVPESSTGIGLILAFILFTARCRCSTVQKF